VLFGLKKIRPPEFLPLKIDKFAGVRPDSDLEKSKPPTISRRSDSLLIVNRISHWVQGLGRLNLPLYFSTYSVVKFKYRNEDFTAWKARRTRELQRIKDINLEIRDITIAFQGPDNAKSRFLLSIRVNGKKKQYQKIMIWKKEGSVWFIVKEGIKLIDRELGASSMGSR
jgi:hypothetical protein